MQERRFMNGQWVTWERCDDEILRQAKAVQIARREGMVTAARGKTVARRKASSLRNLQTVYAGKVAERYAKEKLGANA
jgi:hypothetical protein